MKFWCTAWLVVLASWQAEVRAAEPSQVPREEAAVDARPAPRSWDAVLGFVTSYAPEYAGASRWRLGLTPGGWVRWGRVSIASRSTFVARSGDPVSGGGLRIDLSPNERLRIGLGLRHDSGREESDSADLRGLGDVRSTLRVRLAGSYPLEDGWRMGAALSIDALGHGGGTISEFNVSRGIPLARHTRASFGAAVSFGNRRHLRAYYGVSAEQSARSGYPVYEPDAGARDVAVSAGLRHELNDRWFTFGGISATRLVGPAAASPIVREPNTWAVSAGLAYRF
ncbi:MAG: MipA/OmpV family protein [Burkholderiales bacterium]|nr:MipA/OmpV family protein [Burkholderiales bacterium]